MTIQQIQLVKDSWALVRTIEPEIVANAFYNKLFTDHPSVRAMFPSDMKEQYRKLMTMLNVVIVNLHRLDSLAVDIAQLARRHKEYGAQPAHFTAVGAALLWTLESGLGASWTEPVKEAWVTCYTIISNAMIEAMQEEPQLV
ncbi:MAG: hypothetical protein JNL70_24460 [Saprospiraceae bacterium]|nr:hypothetical protein [Saprospiraceae bacterium]